MNRSVKWFTDRNMEAVEVSPQDDFDLRRGLDGIFLYSVTSDDGFARIDLLVRCRPGELPDAYDISLHTKFPDDPKGDRHEDFTSSIIGEPYVGWLRKLNDPHFRFWEQLDVKLEEWRGEAWREYVLSRPKTDLAGGSPDLPSIQVRLGFDHVDLWEVGHGDFVTCVVAPDMDKALAKYREYLNEQAKSLPNGVLINSRITRCVYIGKRTII